MLLDFKVMYALVEVAAVDLAGNWFKLSSCIVNQ